MRTFTIKQENVKHDWYFVDATGKVLGRLATELARYLVGKHKIQYTPYINVGDYVIVLNAKKVFVTGSKHSNKIYYRHTGYIGGIKMESFKEIITRCPKDVIKLAVKGMLPKGALGRVMYRKLKVYDGNEHPHMAQKPKFLDI